MDNKVSVGSAIFDSFNFWHSLLEATGKPSSVIDEQVKELVASGFMEDAESARQYVEGGPRNVKPRSVQDAIAIVLKGCGNYADLFWAVMPLVFAQRIGAQEPITDDEASLMRSMRDHFDLGKAHESLRQHGVVDVDDQLTKLEPVVVAFFAKSA